MVVLLTGMTDENGWQEIHQVTNAHSQPPAPAQSLAEIMATIICTHLAHVITRAYVCACLGVSPWERAALGAPVVLWG